MRKRPQPNTGELQRAAARQEVRKAGNVLSHAVRLGKVPHVIELDDRGPCATPRCSIEGRLFSINRWVPSAAGGGVYSDLKGRCALCTSQLLGAVS